MGVMTRAQYIESLEKLNMKVYMFGELVDKPTEHPIIVPSMNSLAMTYALAEKAEHQDLMLAKSTLNGETINRFNYLHQSSEDLIKKIKMQNPAIAVQRVQVLQREML